MLFIMAGRIIDRRVRIHHYHGRFTHHESGSVRWSVSQA
jgi:hypothetical protein